MFDADSGSARLRCEPELIESRPNFYWHFALESLNQPWQGHSGDRAEICLSKDLIDWNAVHKSALA